MSAGLAALDILEKQVAARPDDPYLMYQLGSTQKALGVGGRRAHRPGDVRGGRDALAELRGRADLNPAHRADIDAMIALLGRS